MFGETGSTEQRTARLKEKQSLLDSVMQETSKLRLSSARRTRRSSTSI